MNMEGDGPEDQPAEGVTSLDSLASLMDGGEEGDEGALDESTEGEEEVEDTEGEEVEEAEDEDAEDEQDEPTVTLKHDGKEVVLKQSEAVELAQKGFDYTQKTMALAKDREAVEAARTQAETYRQQYEQAQTESIGRLQALEQFLTTQVGTPPPVSLAEQDVALYIAQKEQHEARKGQLEEARKAIANLQEQQARSRQAWVAQQADETERALKDTLPGWNDNTLNDLIAYAGKYGVNQKVADAVLLQKGFWELAHKARAYDELQEKKAQMKPVSKLNKVTPPQAKNQPSQQAKNKDALLRHKVKPSLQTLADLL
jgi:hypothetical protein